MQELLPDLLSRARRLDRDDVTRLADFCEESSINNLEDLLTAAQLGEFCSRNPTVLSVLDFLLFGARSQEVPTRRRARGLADPASVAFLQDTLQILFGLLSSRMLPARPNTGHEAIAKYVSQVRDASIVTTNYDCCMDIALSEVQRAVDYQLDFSNREQDESVAEKTTLLKLHGSLNWFYCETCQDVHLIDIEKSVADS